MKFLTEFAISFGGSLTAVIVALHYDFEGWWQERRLRHGRKLDERQQRSAERHHK